MRGCLVWHCWFVVVGWRMLRMCVCVSFGLLGVVCILWLVVFGRAHPRVDWCVRVYL